MKRWMKRGYCVVVACACLAHVAVSQSLNVGVPAAPVSVGATALVSVQIKNATEVHGYSIALTYDPSLLRYSAAQKSTFLPSGQTMFFVNVDTVAGHITIDEAILGTATQSGSGSLYEVQFVAKQIGIALLGIGAADVRNGQNQSIAVATTGATLQIVAVTGITDCKTIINDCILHQNFPNPFNPSTTIGVTLPGSGSRDVRVTILSTPGNTVATLYRGLLPAGYHQITWEGTDDRGYAVPSGAYFCFMESEGFRKTIRMLLVK